MDPPNGIQGIAQPPARTVIRFGVFDLEVQAGELRKHGVRMKLQGKPLQVLIALLRKPGQVVTREELRAQLWPSDVFVDFDSGLNTAINRLRFVLGDSADVPRYVETVARTGYRFIAPAEVHEVGARPNGRTGTQRRTVIAVAATLAAALLLVSVVAALVALRRPRPADYRFRPVTFRRGQVWGARFAPDGQAILYTANWDNGPRQLFLTNPASPESRPLGFEDLRLVSVSPSGELALMAFDGITPITGGTLLRVPMNGGAPRPVDRNVMSADWSSDGRELAIVRASDGINQLEFPTGTVLHKTPGWMSSVRISPHGNLVAFLEHPVRHDNRGTVKIAGAAQSVRSLTGEWAAVGGIAWNPNGDEVWFTASQSGTPKSLWAVTLGGALRPIAEAAGDMTLRDIGPDGRALASRDTQQLEMAAIVEGEPEQRNLSWLDWSRVADISSDGRTVLFDESGVGAGSQYLVYVHRLDDRTTTRLGSGLAMAFAPGERSVLTRDAENLTRLRLIPIGDGKTEELPPTGLEYQWARYFPTGDRLLALANEPGRPLRLFIQPIHGKPAPITPPGTIRNAAISPDGTRIAVLSPARKLIIYAVPGGAGQTIETTQPLAPILWTDDDWIYVQQVGAYTQIPTRLSRLHLPTGRMEPGRELAPLDLLGVNAITKVVMSRNTQTIVFNYRRVLSELFVTERPPG